MWKVGTETVNGKTNYFLVSTDGTRLEGGFDTELWAQRWADWFNEKDKKAEGGKHGKHTNNSR